MARERLLVILLGQKVGTSACGPSQIKRSRRPHILTDCRTFDPQVWMAKNGIGPLEENSTVGPNNVPIVSFSFNVASPFSSTIKSCGSKV